jgi:hypothetical protein
MARYEVTYVDLRRPADLDAVAVALRVFRDGEYFQFVQAMASGISLATQRRSNIGRDRFWAWFAQEAAEEVKALIARGELPLEDPTQAVILRPSVDRAMQRAELSTIDVLREDQTVASFDV